MEKMAHNLVQIAAMIAKRDDKDGNEKDAK
jgi:hypothetical protein